MMFPKICIRLICLVGGIAAAAAQSQAPPPAEFQNCVPCHGGDAQGGEHGPPIAARLLTLNDEELTEIIRGGKSQIGMPSFALNDASMGTLIRYLRTLERPESQPRTRAKVNTALGQSLEGLVLSQNVGEMQLLTDDHRLHLLRREGESYREVTSDFDWSGYNGDPSGNRYSKLSEINPSNVSRLAPRWIFQLPGGTNLQMTPVVVAGVMYVTSANECWALDAGSGRSIWHYQRRRTRGIGGTAAGGVNRGVAVAGDRVFMVTDNAHLIALDRSSGTLLWDTEMADWRQNYYATVAPLVAGGLVLAGVAGGDDGVRGFVAAFDVAFGKEAWRFWTVPKPGEPGSETWNGKDINHPGGATWLTGTYDPVLDMVYWPTGNAGNDLNGDYRAGDNLYTDSDVALDAKTGKLKWYFQYTPHDVWDWDAVQTPVLVDANWNGQPRKLLLHANRNGFLYVLDRTSGKLLLAKPLVKKLSWASGIGSDGRPVLLPNQVPTTAGAKICPPIEGATNWFSSSFSPETGLYYVQTLEKCGIYTKANLEWKAGGVYMGGTTRNIADDHSQKVLRAFDIHTGEAVWELPQFGDAESWGGVLGTAGGVVFFCDDDGSLAAADARTGKRLWSFQASRLWKASPMTYRFDGQQYVAVATGQSVIAFGLPAGR